MNCERFEELISDYLEGQLSQEVTAEFEAHRAACPDCPELVRQVQRVIALCRAFPEAEPPITLTERILSATLGERHRVSWRQIFDLTGLHWLLNPRLAVGFALVLCSIGLAARFVRSEAGSPEGAAPAILSQLDVYTQKIYSQGVRLYNAKNQLRAEYEYLKTTIFSSIDYHLSQITGQMRQPNGKPPRQEQNKAAPQKREEKKTSLFLFSA